MMRLKTARVWRALLAGAVVAGGGMASVPTLAAPPPSADKFCAHVLHAFLVNDHAQILAGGLAAWPAIGAPAVPLALQEGS
ncbi:hypothetical protein [Rhizobium leguminosarum]|uniref:hypothetical protein n=1 Tax=Rhizobium leguminosarum TaxID=384 RepID=UPI001C94BEA3|nr:hypothetical protein [Rhizobium leguminosarum]